MKHPKLYLDYPVSRPDLQIHCLRCQTLLVVYGFTCYVPPAKGKRKSRRGSIPRSVDPLGLRQAIQGGTKAWLTVPARFNF